VRSGCQLASVGDMQYIIRIRAQWLKCVSNDYHNGCPAMIPSAIVTGAGCTVRRAIFEVDTETDLAVVLLISTGHINRSWRRRRVSP
jgi:hypothetical protein